MIFNLGGAAFETPELNPNYPNDVSDHYIEGESKSATFEVRISKDGFPDEYAYQWYVNDSAVDGATERTYTRTGLTEGVYSIYCEVTNAAGTVQSRTATLEVTLYTTPVLDASYPANVTQFEKENGSATFTVAIDTEGVPASYTYQWYVNGSAVSGATGSSYTKTGLTSAATYTVYCKVTNAAGTVQSRTATLTVQNSQPTYTYSGSHQLIRDGVGNWRIKLKSSGTLRFTYFGAGNGIIDVFCVGGGSGSNTFTGGGGGKTKTASYVMYSNTNYIVTIGGGGAALSNGGRSGFNSDSVYADGGTASSSQYYGGSGGSGGAGYGNDGQGPQASNKNLNGGSDGSAGGTYNPNYPGGSGQGSTTREFGETSGTLYAGGGAGRYSFAGTSSIDGTGGSGGGGNVGAAGGTNTGGGGGASTGTNPNVNVGVSGGSGIVVIRNHR